VIWCGAIRKKNAELEMLRTALIEGEHSGVSARPPDDIRKAVQERMRRRQMRI
jgi:hypothetical protein